MKIKNPFKKYLPSPPHFTTDSAKYNSDLAKWFEDVDPIIDSHFKLCGKYENARSVPLYTTEMFDVFQKQDKNCLQDLLAVQKDALNGKLQSLSWVVRLANSWPNNLSDINLILEYRRDIAKCIGQIQLLETIIAVKS